MIPLRVRAQLEIHYQFVRNPHFSPVRPEIVGLVLQLRVQHLGQLVGPLLLRAVRQRQCQGRREVGRRAEKQEDGRGSRIGAQDEVQLGHSLGAGAH